jgi:hypothetical protein
LFVSAAAINGFKRGGCCVDDHGNRCRKSNRGNPASGKTCYGYDVARRCGSRLPYRGSGRQPAAVNAARAIDDRNDERIVVADEDQRL